MGQTAVKNNAIQGLYRFIDRKQPEVKWALSMSVTLIIFFIAFSLYDNFSIYDFSLRPIRSSCNRLSPIQFFFCIPEKGGRS